jgi:hypothetical protein
MTTINYVGGTLSTRPRPTGDAFKSADKLVPLAITFEPA